MTAAGKLVRDRVMWKAKGCKQDLTAIHLRLIKEPQLALGRIVELARVGDFAARLLPARRGAPLS
jgi:hypothetical protein